MRPRASLPCRLLAILSLPLVFETAARAGGFASAVNYAVGSSPTSVAAGDFNGDGKLDLVAANFGGTTVSVLLGNGDGTFQAMKGYAAGSRPISVAVGDFNGDGMLDLVVVNNLTTGTVSLLAGNGDGTFRAPVTFGVGTSPRSVAVADFNGDGKPDLAVVNQASNNVSILLGNGAGGFGTAVNYSAGSTPVSVTAGDFNRDGNPDLAVADASGGAASTVSVLAGNGDGTFQPAAAYNVGARAESVAAGDFNGDGNLDLAVANFTSNTASVLLGKGDGTFQTAVNYATGKSPISVSTGDFNGDGKLDLAVADFGASNVSVLMGNGNGTFQTAVSYGAAASPRSIVVGDFNGDNAPDLAVADSGANVVSVLLNTGGTFVTTTSSLNPSSAGQAVTFTASVAASIGGSPAPTGSVTFMDGGTALGSASLSSGQANFTTSSLSAGTHTITAAYSGDSNFNPNTGAPLSQVVNSGGNPAVTLSPVSITFPTQVVGSTSKTQNIILTNTGTGTLSIASIVSTDGDFLERNNCGSSVLAGASCAFTVAFKPQSQGLHTGLIQVTDNAPNSPQTVSLSGQGTFLTVSPSSLNFGAVPVGTTSAPQTLTIGNLDNTPELVQFKFAGTAAPEFSETDTCAGSVPARGSCTASLTFKPTQKGLQTATFKVNGGGGITNVPVQGTGQ
jgi:Bacterial Ig-like domain (group 3)/FG-GAP-like repeat/Cep192 domain 4/FG-GAP repeat